MTGKTMRNLLVGLVIAALPMAARAATLEVTHTPAAAQYATVQGAFAAAADGDVIEVIDNSAPFVERIDFIDKSVTLQGRPGLEPRPTIKGTNVSAGGVMGSTIFFWSNSPGTSGQSCDGSTIKNLILDGSKTSISIYGFYPTGPKAITFENCQFLGPRRTEGGARSHSQNVNMPNPALFKNCDFVAFAEGNAFIMSDGNYVINGDYGGYVGTVPNKVAFEDCKFRGGHLAFSAISAMSHELVFKGCDLSSDYADLAMVQLLEPCSLDMSYCVLHPDPASGNAATGYLLVDGYGSLVVKSVAINQCDFIGNGTTTQHFFDNSDPLPNATITNNVIYKMTQPWSSPVGVVAFTEDYNAYYGTSNNLPVAYAKGAHDVEIATGASLYVDFAVGDYRIKADSVANFGGGRYAGSKGLFAPPNAAGHWSLY